MTHTLGKYRIQEELGRGAFATVHRAIDTDLGVERALKVLHPELTIDPKRVARFMQEAKTASSLFHHRIATVLEVGQESGRLYLAMRYVEGSDLGKVLKDRGPLPFEEVMILAGQISEALEFAHKQGLVHRDVKPSNVIIHPDHGAILTDFGLARAADSARLTTTEAAVGTPAYIPPEVWRGKEATPASDVYSLACVVYEMITGDILFGGESAAEIMTKHVLDEPSLPESWPKGVPAGIEKVFNKALVKDPADRYSRAPGFLSDLSQPVPVAEPEPAVEEATPSPPVEEEASTRKARSKKARATKTAAKESLVKEPPATQAPARKAAAKKTPVEEPVESKPRTRKKPPTSKQALTKPKPKVQIPTFVKRELPLDFEWCLVPAGEFLMGELMEKHKVSLPEFWLARYPVTNAQFRLFVDAGGYSEASWWTEAGWELRSKKSLEWPEYWGNDKWNKPQLPVVGVSWYEAMAFCAWAASETSEPIRLASEAEWEKGARGIKGARYPWGDESPTSDRANYASGFFQSFKGKCTPIGQYSPAGDSPYCCAEMAGNVWEWCSSAHRPHPYNLSSNRDDPSLNEKRVLRGGSWVLRYGEDSLRCGSRGVVQDPTFRYMHIGFRCANSMVESA